MQRLGRVSRSVSRSCACLMLASPCCISCAHKGACELSALHVQAQELLCAEAWARLSWGASCSCACLTLASPCCISCAQGACELSGLHRSCFVQRLGAFLQIRQLLLELPHTARLLLLRPLST